jgi:flavin reductase (DIM6/NTAB) family NADH-FMN oxidoreductase RutF
MHVPPHRDHQESRGAFIQGMRRVANSVTVVTTNGAAGRHGATVSAFCSVSADPPTLLVCLNADSRIARAVSANRTFCVNVLNNSAQRLADRFAGRFDALHADRFADVGALEHPSGWPILSDSVVSFCCDLQDAARHATHLVTVGQVVASHTFDCDRPLAYWSGHYGTIFHYAAAMPEPP